MFGRATIRLGIGPHSSCPCYLFIVKGCMKIWQIFVVRTSLWSLLVWWVYPCCDEQADLHCIYIIYMHCVVTIAHLQFTMHIVFSERSLYAVARPSVCLSSVTFVRPTQAVQIFGNISMALGTVAIHWNPLKILRRSSKGNPSAGGVKHKKGSKL